jgi:hypothetical protein
LSSKPNLLLEPSPYKDDAGELIGRHPKDLTKADLEAAGLRKLVGLKAIRAKCLHCCEHSPSEVRRCVSVGCPLWPMRMGTNPWNK